MTMNDNGIVISLQAEKTNKRDIGHHRLDRRFPSPPRLRSRWPPSRFS